MVNSYNGKDDKLAEDNIKFKTGRDGGSKYLNYGEEDEMEIQGYVFNTLKHYCMMALYVITFGLLRLFFHWYPHLHLVATHNRCSLKNAGKVLVIDSYKKYKSYFVKEIKTLKATLRHSEHRECALTFNLCEGGQTKLEKARMFKCKKLTYIWDDDKGAFIKLCGLDKGITRSELHSMMGQSRDEQFLRRIVYGNNEINVPVQTILALLVLEALTPFYVFQLFSLIVWISEYYLYYTFAIIIMSVAGISTSIIQTRKNQKNLRGTVNTKATAIVRRADSAIEEIPTTDLVPGDIIVIDPQGCDMQCDAVLLNGSCVVNESMLTGESVPITKTPLPNNFVDFNMKEDVNHTLFCGTRVIQTRSVGDKRVEALVIRTGYLTTKGELVRSILYPPPADFKFETDSYKFIGILAVIALISVIYTIVSKTTRKIDPIDILLKALDVITIAVPPALPAAMTVGKLYALHRLKKKNIFCINSRVINVSGSVDCVCFDKTGTLTEDEMDMWGVVPVENNQIKEPVRQAHVLPFDSILFRGMATCHSLSIINGELGGDPLDVKMFEATDWVINYSNNQQHSILVRPKVATKDNVEIGILKQFQFSSTLQRMSVIIQASDTMSYRVFCKGSPEMITSLSKPSSLPHSLSTTLSEFTKQGYRVIALGTKLLEDLEIDGLAKLNREDVECDLEFIGLIVLENKLKPQTSGVIYTLKNANLKVVMITGDNIQTGVHVAKECQIVSPDEYIIEIIAEDPTKLYPPSLKYEICSHPKLQECENNNDSTDIEMYAKRKYCFAITGKSWGNVVNYFPELVPNIVAKGNVFARMSGMQKQQLIEEFKHLGYYVAMCGDGANDCGALKAAHVGISLSEAESSVASPFTSKDQNISCVPKVIKEGRAALVTSFGVFKVMLCYSLTELTSVLILYTIDANLSSMQFLFIDICLILNFASFFGNNEAYCALSRKPPMTSLMAFIPITSMLLFMVLVTAFQVAAFYWIQIYSWFTPFVFTPDEQKFLCFEDYAVFVVSMFQYVAMVIVFSKGKPYRKPIYTNKYFTLSLIITTVICAYMTIAPPEWLADLMEMKMPPMEARYAMIVISLISFLVFWIVEDLIVDVLLERFIAPTFTGQTSKQKFLAALTAFDEDSHWPKVTKNDVILNDFNEAKAHGVVNNGFVGSQDNLITKC